MADINKRKLKYESELNPFMDFIQSEYCESSLCVFRSVLSIPPTEIDSTPQSKRLLDFRTDELDIQLSKEDVDLMTDEERKEYVGNLAISVFKSSDKAQKNVREFVRHIAKSYSNEEAKAYLEERRGPYVVRLQLSPEVGLLEKKFNKKGHANLLLYEDVDIKDHIVEVYPPLRFSEIVSDIKNEGTNDGDKK